MKESRVRAAQMRVQLSMGMSMLGASGHGEEFDFILPAMGTPT